MCICEETVDIFLSFYGLKRKKPGIKFLTEIYTAYFHIPYENITKIIKSHSSNQPESCMRLPDELIEEHLRYRMGGTCFSLAYALQKILDRLGFETYFVTADVQGIVDNHVALVSIVNNTRFLIDPGFTIPNVIEISEDRVTYGHNPVGRVKLEYTGVGRLFKLSNRNLKVEKTRLILKEMPVDECYFKELWKTTFVNDSLDTINICSVIDNKLVHCRNEILTEYTTTGKFQKSIAHDFSRTVERIFGFPSYITYQAYTLLKKDQDRKQVAL